MEGWTIFVFGGVSALGTHSFLRLVACEFERVAQQLKRAELTTRRALARQRKLDAEEPFEAQAA